MYHEGLKISAANVAAGTAYIRDGRQKTGNADASHWATTARLKSCATASKASRSDG